jgi:ribosomal protein S18 acetylase RimI-like enzyme
VLPRFQVVPAVLPNARAVAQIHVDAWRAAYRALLPAQYLASLSVDEREAMWREAIAAGVPALLIAKDDDGAVRGWLSYGACRDEGAPHGQAEIWALYVSPDAWSTGAGRMLWQRARERMIEQGYTSCSLWVFAGNDRAIRFYRAAGFLPDPRPHQAFELGGRQVHEARYVCRLAP